MRRLIYIFVILSAIISAQVPDKFVIGADWGNPVRDTTFGGIHYNPKTSYHQLSSSYWDTIKSFGLNYVSLSVGNNPSLALAELDVAYNKTIGLNLFTYNYTGRDGIAYMFQAEGGSGFFRFSPWRRCI